MPNQVSFFTGILLVFFGGGFGSIVRYLVSYYIAKITDFGKFPLGTFIVNVLGSFILGFLFSKMIDEPTHSLRFLLMIGFCGGFTTFSTFSLENFELWSSQNYFILFLNIFLSIILGILAVYLGFKLGIK